MKRETDQENHASRFFFFNDPIQNSPRSTFRAKPKYDGVIEAVRYDDQGQVLWVRGFLRRGPIWSDHIQLDRQELIDTLNSGKVFMTGERIPYLGSTFETSSPVKVVKVDQKEILVSGDGGAKTDNLEGVPII